jgi:hypothetical protein
VTRPSPNLAWPSVGYRREALGMAYPLERDVDYGETSRRLSCSAKSLKSLMLKVASGKSWARQHAAIQLSLAGRGRPRRLASAEILPYVREVASSESKPQLEIFAGARSPAARGRPLPQFADGHERHAPGHAGQSRGQRISELALDRPGRHIGVKDDVAHWAGQAMSV